MYIQSQIQRLKGSSVTLGSMTYTFAPQPWSKSEHVAFVQSKEHQNTLLAQDNFIPATVQGPSGDGEAPDDKTSPLNVVCSMIEENDLLAEVLKHFAVTALFEGQDDPNGLSDEQRATIAIATLAEVELNEDNRTAALAALGVDHVGDAAPSGETAMLPETAGVPDPDAGETKLTPLEAKAIELDAMNEDDLRLLFAELKKRNANKNAKVGTIRDAIFEHYKTNGLT